VNKIPNLSVDQTALVDDRLISLPSADRARMPIGDDVH